MIFIGLAFTTPSLEDEKKYDFGMLLIGGILITRVLIAVFHFTIILYCLEAYPTQLRAFSVGMVYMIQNFVAGILGNFRQDEDGSHINHFDITFAIIALYCSFAVRKLEETHDKELQEIVIEETE